MLKFVVLCLSLCLATGLTSQPIHSLPTAEPEPLSVKSLTVEDGLPQGFINGIVQDAQGFVWMGTMDGLVKYNGRSLNVFKHDTNDSTSLAANVLETIYKDKANNIWIIYGNGEVDILNPFTERVRHISQEPAFAWLRKKYISYPYNLIEDSHHEFWIISQERKLHHFSLTHSSPQRIALPEDEAAFSIKEDKGVLWLLTNKALYTLKNGALKRISYLPKPISKTSVEYPSSMGTMVRDIHGHWIMGGKGYIQIYNENDDSWQLINIGTQLSRFFTVSSDGTVYCNADVTLCRLNADHSLSLIWVSKPGGFISLTTDRSDVLWIGTNTFGARLINLASKGFHSFPYQYGFFNDVLLKWLHIPHDVRSWLLFDQYGCRTAVDRAGNLWSINLPSHNIDGHKWTRNDSIYMFKLVAGTAAVYAIKMAEKGWGNLQNITFDNQNRCWATLSTGELVEIVISSKTATTVLSLKKFSHPPVYLTAAGNKLCFVFNEAIEIYDSQTRRRKVYSGAGVFRNTNLLMATADPQDASVLWVASMGNGLIRFDTKTGMARAFTEKEGIPSNTVYAIVPDKRGFLWCSSNNGIFRFNPKDSSLVSFTAKDGLQGNEFNRYHFLALPDEHIIFGGTEGWTVFHPDSIRVDRFQPPVAVTEILVNNTPLHQLPSWKGRSVSALERLPLSYQQNFLTFYFSGLQFNEPDKLQYRYKMEGIDRDWVKIGNRNMANYTNLPPGSYTFKVNCTNTSGVWSTKIKAMQVIISPPWWETVWAYLCYALLGCAATIAFYRNRMNIIRSKQEALLKQREAAQLRAVDEMKSRFFSNITHEFRTPLSLIIAPLEEMEKDAATPVAVKKKLAVVQRNAHQLARLINQLLDLSKLEAGNMKTSISRGDLNSFIEDCVKSFEPFAASKQLHLHFEAAAVAGESLFDAGKMEKIMFNLLSNAIKFTPEGGRITVQVNAMQESEETYTLQLNVRDTGIGIPADKLPKIFNRFYQVNETSTRAYEGTGIGLALAKELTELMGGTIHVESTPEAGTTFHVAIPVQKATDQQVPVWSGNVFVPEVTNGSIAEVEEPLPVVSNTNALILIVEDNKELSQFIAGALQANYRILTAANGAEGLKKAEEELPDIIISDVMMPEMNGYELCRHIKSGVKTSHIAFVILTAKASHDSVMEGLLHSADDYITKPFHIDELGLRIRNILDHQEKIRLHHNVQLTNPHGPGIPKAEENEFLQQLYTVIDENIDDSSLSVEKLAGKMAVSHRTLNRKLNALVGLSANEVIRQYRLKKAGKLLKSGHKISDVAYSVGFDTPSYFSASFKTFYGVTPSEYCNISV